jgi:hypothetical protein
VAIEGLVQLAGGGDQRCGRRSARLARRIQDSDEAVILAILYPFNTGPDVRAIQAVERAVDRAARDALLRAAPGREHDMPVRTLVQAGKIILPNLMIPAEEPRNDMFGGFGLGDIGVHRNHRFQILPSNSSVVRSATLEKGIFRELAGVAIRLLRHTSIAFLP